MVASCVAAGHSTWSARAAVPISRTAVGLEVTVGRSPADRAQCRSGVAVARKAAANDVADFQYPSG